MRGLWGHAITPAATAYILDLTDFRENFSQCIGKRRDIRDADKFSYLVGQLDGEAAKAIRGIAERSENYHRAVTALHLRFNDQQRVIAKHTQAIANTPSVRNVTQFTRMREMVEDVSLPSHDLTGGRSRHQLRSHHHPHGHREATNGVKLGVEECSWDRLRPVGPLLPPLYTSRDPEPRGRSLEQRSSTDRHRCIQEVTVRRFPWVEIDGVSPSYKNAFFKQPRPTTEKLLLLWWDRPLRHSLHQSINSSRKAKDFRKERKMWNLHESQPQHRDPRLAYPHLQTMQQGQSPPSTMPGANRGVSSTAKKPQDGHHPGGLDTWRRKPPLQNGKCSHNNATKEVWRTPFGGRSKTFIKRQVAEALDLEVVGEEVVAVYGRGASGRPQRMRRRKLQLSSWMDPTVGISPLKRWSLTRSALLSQHH